MAIELDVRVTGGELGHKLAGDPEETFYMLKELAEDAPASFAKEVAEYGYGVEDIAQFLRGIADELDKAAS